MLDFLIITTRSPKKDLVEILPDFDLTRNDDLMIRGGDFYAIWCEDLGRWSTDERDVIRLIDKELDIFAAENKEKYDCRVKVLHMRSAQTGMIDRWHKYCKQQLRDRYQMLDQRLIFMGMETSKEDYSSKRLPYSLEPGPYDAWDKLVGTLYSPEERHKIEWCIGAIVCGASKKLHKFMTLYGPGGTGKSTVLDIIKDLFEGYTATFDAEALGSTGGSFAMESFNTNPLVAIQYDGNLSKIETNSRLNTLIAHEPMAVNTKFKSIFTSSFNTFLFLGTNRPVKITDARSGLIRRLIDVSPSGDLLDPDIYEECKERIKFEHGAIAYHCKEVFEANSRFYSNYIPVVMMGASNDFYNFMTEPDVYSTFLTDDGTTIASAWEQYKKYCTRANVPYPMSYRAFQEELRAYFKAYKERYTLPDGTRVRRYLQGFLVERFENVVYGDGTPTEKPESWLKFDKTESIFDRYCEECPAQYASEKETPSLRWDDVIFTLKDIDTTQLHYVKIPVNHIVIDFDIPGEDGSKSFEKNLEAASKFPPTYAELSKSGKGIHLHYIYKGDPTKLSRVYGDHIEIKVFTGKSSLRRMLTKCNDIPIADISSNLPLKGEDKMLNTEAVKTEKGLRTLIKKNLAKAIHPGTKPSIDFIHHILEDAYKSGLQYDVSDLRSVIFLFAADSTNHAEYCMEKVHTMKFKSGEASENTEPEDPIIVFVDVEVFPNLLLVNWKFRGKDKNVVRMINPSPKEVEALMDFALVGFNNRDYDNHILYARMIGQSIEQLYILSKNIIVNKKQEAKFREAYNLSYTDVYDFCSKKQSLKKWEIELGIHHQELGLPWDQPVPEELWDKVAAYCDNDVIATEAVFEANQADFTARKILADVAGMTVNDKTNNLTARIIFGKNKNPQSVFKYRNMGLQNPVHKKMIVPALDCDWDYTVFNDDGTPVFPGYIFKYGKSEYRGEDPKEGGYVYATPGIHTDVALLDIASMHPSSIVAEQLFGEYTARFEDILNARLAIKHREFDKARTMLGGSLAKYLTDEKSADELAQALKIAINSVYGLTSAKFSNPFKDDRNVDNIVAKRGALFMINLKHEVMAKGFTVAHIKTDSIKIPNATPEIIDFVTQYGKLYGYNFEHEATYDRMCLVNDAVYIAKYATVERCCELYGSEYVNSAKDICKNNKKHPGDWTATGTQFQVPYVFKKLFTRESIEFGDMCETKQVSTNLYLDMNEDLSEGEHNYQFIGKVGLFCPIQPGHGGGILVREAVDKEGNVKYDNATGAKGYRWLEAEVVKNLELESYIDRHFYDDLVTAAAETIASYGDLEAFVDAEIEDPINIPDVPPEDEVPF